MNWFYYTFIYWRLRKFLAWFCKKAKMQCHGKQKRGFAFEWCKLRAFHEGACISAEDKVFKYSE